MRSVQWRHAVRLAFTHKDIRAFLHINKALNNTKLLLSFSLLFFRTSLDQNIFFFCRFLATANYNREPFRWGQSQNVQEKKWKCFNGLKEKILSKEHADTECYVLHTGWRFHRINSLTRVESVSCCFLCFTSLTSALCAKQLNESRTVTLRHSDSPAVVSAATKQFFRVCDLSFIRQRRKNLQKERENNMRNAKPNSLYTSVNLTNKSTKKITFCRNLLVYNFKIFIILFSRFNYAHAQTLIIVMFFLILIIFNGDFHKCFI